MFDRTHPVGVGLQQTSFKIVAYLFITFLLEDVTYLCDNLLTLSYGFEQQWIFIIWYFIMFYF